MLTDYIHALECIFFKLSSNVTDFSGLKIIQCNINGDFVPSWIVSCIWESMFLREVKINKLIDQSVEGNLNFLRCFTKKCIAAWGELPLRSWKFKAGCKKDCKAGVWKLITSMSRYQFTIIVTYNFLWKKKSYYLRMPMNTNYQLTNTEHFN